MERRSSRQKQQEAELAKVLLAAVTNSYERAFSNDPSRAEAAQHQARQTVSLLKFDLDRVGITPELAVAAGLDEARLHIILGWAAFDYSVSDSVTGNFEIVDPPTLVRPMLLRLMHNKGNITDMTTDFQNSIMAMRMYRYEMLLGPVPADPNRTFVHDFEVANGDPFIADSDI